MAAEREESATEGFERHVIEGQNEALRLIISGAPLVEVFRRLIAVVERGAAGEAAASILLFDAATNTLRRGAAPSLPDDFSRAVEAMAVRADVGTCVAAAARNETVITPDIAAAPGWQGFVHLPLALGLVAVWSTPIVSAGGRVLGTFGVYLRRRREPTDTELRLAAMLAKTAALAIERREEEERLRTALADTARRKRLYEAVLSTTPDLVYVFDLTHRFTYANTALLAMWGRAAEEAIGKNCLELGYEPWHGGDARPRDRSGRRDPAADPRSGAVQRDERAAVLRLHFRAGVRRERGGGSGGGHDARHHGIAAGGGGAVPGGSRADARGDRRRARNHPAFGGGGRTPLRRAPLLLRRMLGGREPDRGERKLGPGRCAQPGGCADALRFRRARMVAGILARGFCGGGHAAASPHRAGGTGELPRAGRPFLCGAADQARGTLYGGARGDRRPAAAVDGRRAAAAGQRRRAGVAAGRAGAGRRGAARGAGRGARGVAGEGRFPRGAVARVAHTAQSRAAAGERRGGQSRAAAGGAGGFRDDRAQRDARGTAHRRPARSHAHRARQVFPRSKTGRRARAAAADDRDAAAGAAAEVPRVDDALRGAGGRGGAGRRRAAAADFLESVEERREVHADGRHDRDFHAPAGGPAGDDRDRRGGHGNRPDGRGAGAGV